MGVRQPGLRFRRGERARTSAVALCGDLDTRNSTSRRETAYSFRRLGGPGGQGDRVLAKDRVDGAALHGKPETAPLENSATTKRL